MRTPLCAMLLAAFTCTLSAQPINLDIFHVDVQNEVSVNTKHSEFGMVKSVGNTYMFTSDRNKFNDKNQFLAESSYKMYSCNPAAEYGTVRPMAVNYNSNSNNGPATPVKNNEFYFTSTNKKATLNWMEGTKTNMLTISRATLVDGKWKVEVIKEFKSTKYSFGQPAISKDGRTLFFVSDMEGGVGATDLYVSYRTDEGWTEPENLGAQVNSDGRDSYPYFHESGILFFASEGHGGFGGLDLFMTYKSDEGWVTPENLGSPFNTASDDFSLYLDRNLSKGYFASNREGGIGGDDIYSFSLSSLDERNEPLATTDEIEAGPISENTTTILADESNAASITAPVIDAASASLDQ